MTITSASNDKYAFLFSGPTQARFVKDLENVVQMLVDYYNYPPAHIRVVLGATLAPMPGFAGAPVTLITNASDLSNALSAFAGVATGTDKSVLLYFTGGGIPAASGATNSKLIITGGAAPASIDATWLKPKLNALSPSHVNVVMQQPGADGFRAAFQPTVLTEWSFTSACKADEQSYGDFPVVEGSFFTHAFVQALRLETLPAGTPDTGKYADQLGSGPEGPNRLVSLQEAMAFGKQIHDFIDGMAGISTPGYFGPLAGGVQYLGLPAFLIRDGSPWWESPDIFLTHPNNPGVPPGDLYIPDPAGALPPYNNTVNVVIRNIGTHPVRVFALHVQLFHSGGGGTSVSNDNNAVIPSGGVLLPIDATDAGTAADKNCTYQWNVLFDVTSTHQCVKAEAALLASDIDLAWDVVAKDNEGQRNIDEMIVVPPPPMPTPFMNIQGLKEHLFSVYNRFKEPHTFMVALPKEFLDLQQKYGLNWFTLPKGTRGERVPVKLGRAPLPNLVFKLNPRQETPFLLQVKLDPKVNIREAIRIPAEIWAEGDWPKLARKKIFDVDLPKFAPVAGLTLVLETGAATLAGVVMDRYGKEVGGASVHLQTIDQQQEGKTLSERNGWFVFPDINPDVYLVWAELGTFKSKPLTAVLLRDRKEEVKLIIDSGK